MRTAAIRRFVLFAASVATIACHHPVAPDSLLPGAAPATSVNIPPLVSVTGRIEAVDTMPQAWQLAVRFRNDGREPVTVEHGACSVAVWLYRADGRSGPPAWDNGLPRNGACILIGYLHSLAPGETYDLLAGRLTRARLGNSVPPGRYLVRLAVRTSRTGGSSDERLLVLPASTVTLAP
jgi:hypothetical protein